MSQTGQSRHLDDVRVTSGLPPIADIGRLPRLHMAACITMDTVEGEQHLPASTIRPPYRVEWRKISHRLLFVPFPNNVRHNARTLYICRFSELPLVILSESTAARKHETSAKVPRASGEGEGEPWPRFQSSRRRHFVTLILVTGDITTARGHGCKVVG